MNGDRIEVLDELEVVARETEAVAIRDEAKALLIATLRPVAERLETYQHEAMSILVLDKSGADRAGEIMAQIKRDGETVNEMLDATVERFFGLHRALTGFRNRFRDPLKAAHTAIKQKVIAWQELERQKAEAQQRALQAAADERARVEREKAEAAARLQREKEAQAQREAEEARQKAARAKNAADRERFQKEAEQRQAEATAAAARAEAKEDKAASVTAPVIVVEAQKAAGIKSRTDWKFEIVDATKIPREYMMPDEKKIGAVVKATRGSIAIAGVRAYSVKV